MYNLFRYAAQQEPAQSFPPMGTYHDEVVVLSCLTDRPDGITDKDIRRNREVRTVHYPGCIGYELLSLLSSLSRNNIAFDDCMFADMQCGNDRQDGKPNGGLKGVRSQPPVQTSRVRHIMHCKENAVDGASISFHDQGWNR